MKAPKPFLSSLGSVLFYAGILLGMVFFAGLTWPNLEANFYFGYNGGADTKLRLSCPPILTSRDAGAITASVHNKVDKSIDPILEAQISSPILRTVRSQPSIDPGTTASVKWDVGAEDVAYGHLILAQVYQYASYKTLTAMATCGSLFIYMSSLSGTQVYLLALSASLLLIIAGMVLWLIGSRTSTGRSRERFSGMILLAILVGLGILLGSLGVWILGTIVLVLVVLMLVIQLSRGLMPS